MDNQILLSIRNLRLELMSIHGIVYALSDVSLDIRPGEIHGLVGESGCGKSMTAKSVLRLHDPKRSRLSGEILFEGRDLLTLPQKDMQQIRGNRISMIFQDPMTSLNPLLTIGEQISETFRQHEKCSKAEAKEKAIDLLEKIGISPAPRRYAQYPYELSGGLQQRVMIAIAIACGPSLLIADEPTTALDVTIQAQVLELLKQLSDEMNMSILLITHNFGVVAEICDRVSVMYAGRVVETGASNDIFTQPNHPYTRALIRSIPRAGSGGEYLPTIPGAPPALFHEIHECPYRERCSCSIPACSTLPPATDRGNGHLAACHRTYEEMKGC